MQKSRKCLTVGNTRQLYSLIKTLGRKFTPRRHVTRDQEGKILQSQEEIAEKWTVYSDNLYKDHEGDDNMVRDRKCITSTNTEGPQDILYSEVEEAICLLEKNKILGPDGIKEEML